MRSVSRNQQNPKRFLLWNKHSWRLAAKAIIYVWMSYRCCWSWRLDQGADCLILTGGFWRKAAVHTQTDIAVDNE
jgi:hypothetical protein